MRRWGGGDPFPSPHPSKPRIWSKISVGLFARDLPGNKLRGVVKIDAEAAHLADLHYGDMQGARVPGGRDSLNVTVAADQACRL